MLLSLKFSSSYTGKHFRKLHGVTLLAIHQNLCVIMDLTRESFCIASSPVAQCVARRAPYAAVRMVAGSRPVLVIAWEWHIGLALLCGCSGALEYPTTNSCGPINKILILNPYPYLRCTMNHSGSRSRFVPRRVPFHFNFVISSRSIKTKGFISSFYI